MEANYQARINTLLERLNMDAVALVPGANMVYFTGLHVHRSERPTIAIITREHGLNFIMPRLEMIKLEQRPDLNAKAFPWADEDGYLGAFKTAVDTLKLNEGRFGVDGMTMRVFELKAFDQTGANMTRIQDVGQDLLNIRAIKSNDEVEAMRRAIKISEQALANTIEKLSAGMTEQGIASMLGKELSALGSEALAFETIVLIGENAALPHGIPGKRTLQNGDFLLFDFGGMVDGYPADITRTFVFGDASDEHKRIYEAVRGANAAARAIAKPGVTCSAVDQAARQVIVAAGYGDQFTHRTGHGLGLEGHELPQIATGNDAVLEVGMVFTIEPGVYIEGFGGVRIEDDVVVTADGIESLTTYPRELMQIN